MTVDAAVVSKVVTFVTSVNLLMLCKSFSDGVVMDEIVDPDVVAVVVLVGGGGAVDVMVVFLVVSSLTVRLLKGLCSSMYMDEFTNFLVVAALSFLVNRCEMFRIVVVVAVVVVVLLLILSAS